jgi:hypothetical protein
VKPKVAMYKRQGSQEQKEAADCEKSTNVTVHFVTGFLHYAGAKCKRHPAHDSSRHNVYTTSMTDLDGEYREMTGRRVNFEMDLLGARRSL